MKEPALKLRFEATNDISEHPPMKAPDPNDKDAPKWKRLAPRRPAQQPEDPPNKKDADD